MYFDASSSMGEAKGWMSKPTLLPIRFFFLSFTQNPTWPLARNPDLSSPLSSPRRSHFHSHFVFRKQSFRHNNAAASKVPSQQEIWVSSLVDDPSQNSALAGEFQGGPGSNLNHTVWVPTCGLNLGRWVWTGLS